MSVTRRSLSDMEITVVDIRKKFFKESSLISRLIKERELLMNSARRSLAQEMFAPKLSINEDYLKYLGRHWVEDFNVGDIMKNFIMSIRCPEKYLLQILHIAAKSAKATILNEMCFANEKHIVATIVIEESHLSLHFLPDKNFAAVDVFTCGEIQFDKAIYYISKLLQARSVKKMELKRGLYAAHSNKFIPGIAIQFYDQFFFLTEDKPGMLSPASLGKHMIVEFYLCNAGRVNNAEFVRDTFNDAICLGGGTVKKHHVQCFQPQGISDVTLGMQIQAEQGSYFHLTMHNWPEKNPQEFGAYAALDLCNFADINLQKVIEHLQQEFQCQRACIYTLARGLPRQLQTSPLLLEASKEEPSQKMALRN